jgi:predicted MPP superfamily phosphohydrolase
MRYQLFLFISIALLIYFGLHTFLFFLLTHFFTPGTRSARWGLALILLFLALSFITAFIWTQFSNHKLLQGYYYASAIWLGTMVNLLLIFGAGLLTVTILRWFFPGIDYKTFGFFLLGIAVLYTGYGLFHAGQLNTIFLTVSIKNAPKEWHGKKIAQVSDVHLGIMNGERLARKIATIIDRQQVNYIFITGDLFDGVGDDLYQDIQPIARLKCPIYYITGNHETYLGIEKAVAVIEKTKIKLLRDEIIELDGVQLIGIDYPQRGWRKDIQPVLEKMDRSKPAILLYHEPAQIETARHFPIALQLSGHTHNGQFWPLKIFTALIYQGFDYGFHQMGDYSIYTTSGAGTWGPPMRIGSTAEVVIITIQ